MVPAIAPLKPSKRHRTHVRRQQPTDRVEDPLKTQGIDDALIQPYGGHASRQSHRLAGRPAHRVGASHRRTGRKPSRERGLQPPCPRRCPRNIRGRHRPVPSVSHMPSTLRLVTPTRALGRAGELVKPTISVEESSSHPLRSQSQPNQTSRPRHPTKRPPPKWWTLRQRLKLNVTGPCHRSQQPGVSVGWERGPSRP